MRVQGAAPADLDHLAELVRVGGLADQAEIRDVAVRLHPFQHPHGAVGGGTLLVAGDQQAYRTARRRPLAQVRRRRRHETGDAALHVAGAATVEDAVAELGAEGSGMPRRIPRRHHVGVARETDMRCAGADAGEQVGRRARRIAERQVGDGEAEFGQGLREHRLRPAIVGRDRGRADQRLRQVQGQRPGRQGGGQSRNNSLTAVFARVRASTRLTITAQARPGRTAAPPPPAAGSEPGTTTE